MGSADNTSPADHEGPVRTVQVEPFSIDRYALTNARFAAFPAGSGYQTDAERFGWSFVFQTSYHRSIRLREPRPPPLQRLARHLPRKRPPVNAFEPNGFGLYNVVGKVWERTADAWNSSCADPGAEEVQRPE